MRSFWVSISVAVGLLALNLVGFAVGPVYWNPDSTAGAGDIPGYHYRLRSNTELQGMLEERISSFDLEIVTSVVFESLIHADDRRIQPQENWIMWLAGLAYEPASKTQSAQRIVSGGRALCSEASAVVNEISKVNGLDARLVALNGHIVSEVRTANGWQISDPDYGVVFPVDFSTLEAGGMSTLMAEKLSLRGFSNAEIATYIEFFESTDDNTVLETGSPSSPRLYVFERISEWFKWIVPVALIFASIIVARTRSGNTKQRRTN